MPNLSACVCSVFYICLGSKRKRTGTSCWQNPKLSLKTIMHNRWGEIEEGESGVEAVFPILHYRLSWEKHPTTFHPISVLTPHTHIHVYYTYRYIMPTFTLYSPSLLCQGLHCKGMYILPKVQYKVRPKRRQGLGKGAPREISINHGPKTLKL